MKYKLIICMFLLLISLSQISLSTITDDIPTGWETNEKKYEIFYDFENDNSTVIQNLNLNFASGDIATANQTDAWTPSFVTSNKFIYNDTTSCMKFRSTGTYFQVKSSYSANFADGFHRILFYATPTEITYSISPNTQNKALPSNINEWMIICSYYNGTDVNSTIDINLTSSPFDYSSTFDYNNKLYYMARGYDGTLYFDWLAIFNGSDPTNIKRNEFVYTPPILSNFSVKSYDYYNNSIITNFSLIVKNSSGYNYFNTTNGEVITPIQNGSLNITVWSEMDGGYQNLTFLNINSSSGNLTVNLTPHYRLNSVSFSKFSTYNFINYSRNLSYNINLICSQIAPASLNVYANNSFVKRIGLNCNNQTQVIISNYTHIREGSFPLKISLNTSYKPKENNEFSSTYNFYSDLYNPVVKSLSINASNSFNSNDVTIGLVCNDSASPLLNYNITFNNVLLEQSNHTRGYVLNKSSNALNGVNNYIGTCKDFFGKTTSNKTQLINFIKMVWIDEIDNTIFNVQNVTSAKVYFDDNSSYFDFKTNNTNEVNFTSITNDKLRFELTYPDGGVITRYVDVSLIPTGTLRVCANKEGVTHYQQLITSATSQKVFLKNVFSDCIIAADYTRFAYQDAFILKAFTIDSYYYLYTYDGSDQVLLASVDGSIQTYIDIDTLEFKKEGYNINIAGSSLTFKKNAAQEIIVYYDNLKNDNTAMSLSIIRLDTDEQVFQTSDFSDPNEWTLYFNWATLNNVTNSTVFKIQADRQTSSGNFSENRYFNNIAKAGWIQSGIGFAAAFILMFFGLSLTVARLSFSWFGIAVSLGGIAITSFSIGAWYITLLQGIIVIIMVYQVIIMVQQNYQTVS